LEAPEHEIVDAVSKSETCTIKSMSSKTASFLPQNRLLVLFAILGTLFLFFADLFAGPVEIPAQEVFSIIFLKKSTNPVWLGIIWDLRLPKALTALIAGSALSLAGLLTQSLFRNPLTGPDMIGITSGASLFVAIAVLTGLGSEMGFTLALAASAGSATVFALVLMVAPRVSNSLLLILGLMLSALISSVVVSLQFISPAEELQQFAFWSMGTLSKAGYHDLTIMGGTFITGLMLAASSLKGLNANAMGTGFSTSIGINAKSLRWKILLSTALLTGSITTFCGPITFVGIAAPHLVKQIFQIADHRKLIPLSLLAGSSMLLACDVLIQLTDTLIPVNAATSILGAPVIIWVILTNRRDLF
jgi:iron complex transport system permease protein